MSEHSTPSLVVRGADLMSSRVSYAVVIALLLLGAFLRVHDLANLPLGFSDDEIINIRLVDNVRQGDIYVFYPGEEGGREGLYHVLLAAVTSFVGEGSIGFRVLSLWLGMLSIAIVYTLGHHLFHPLVGVVAAGLIAINMSAILLARAVSSDATTLFLAAATMLALARSLPVYRRARVVTSNVLSFAALGILLGVGFYLHPSSLFIVLGAMLYIAHLLYIRNAMFRQRGSYTGFAILLMLILSMPYLISSINLSQYSAGQRLLAHYDENILRSIFDGLLGIVQNGDGNPIHNLPGRPLVDVFSGLFMLLGLLLCIRRRRRPRFMFMLISFFVTLPAALIVDGSPNFHRMSVVMPQLAIFAGFGVYALIRASIFVDRIFQRMAVVGLLALLLINLIWTWQDLFLDWRDNPEVTPLVNGDLGRIAHYLDVSGHDLPLVFCNASWMTRQPEPALSNADKTLLMMNRRDFQYHEADCSRSLLMTNGGATQRIVFFDAATRERVHPYLGGWLAEGRAVTEGVPRDAIIELDTTQLLADRAGRFITTAPLSFAPEAAESLPLSPPIRFGGDLTFLGYEPTVERQFAPGDTVDVITYWRAEGALLPDLTFFNHILSDPITRLSNNDVILVNPARLRDRDVFIQVTSVPIPELARPGRYIVSVGAYRQNTPERPRLPVFHLDEPRGDRLFLYAIEIQPPPTQESG